MPIGRCGVCAWPRGSRDGRSGRHPPPGFGDACGADRYPLRTLTPRPRRTPRLISEADNAYFRVAVVASGIGRISQDGRQAVLGPGDCVLYETTRPFQWLFHSDWDVWVFSLPSESVRLSDSERRLISSRRLDGAAGLTGVVSRFLIHLARHTCGWKRRLVIFH